MTSIVGSPRPGRYGHVSSSIFWAQYARRFSAAAGRAGVAYARAALVLLCLRLARNDPHDGRDRLRRGARDVDPVREETSRLDARVDPRARRAAVRRVHRLLLPRTAQAPAEATQASTRARQGKAW